MEIQKFAEFASRFNVAHYNLPILLVEQIASSEAKDVVFKTAPSDRDAALLSVKGRQKGEKPLDNAFIVNFQQFEKSIHTGISVGRANSNKIVLQDNSISKMHASFKLNIKNEWVVVDVESENQTRHNGKIIESNKPVVLKNEDGITFADVYHCTFFLPAGFKTYIESMR